MKQTSRKKMNNDSNYERQFGNNFRSFVIRTLVSLSRDLQLIFNSIIPSVINYTYTSLRTINCVS